MSINIMCLVSDSELAQLEEVLHYGEWLVCDNECANEMCKNYIRETVWAFNSTFIREHINPKFNIALGDIAWNKFAAAMVALCEDANEILLALLEDFDTFASDAIKLNGRAYFLSTYDAKEIEIRIEGKTFFAYRTN